MPITAPKGVTDATAALLVDQVPEAAPVSVKFQDEPPHSTDTPAIDPAYGAGLTVMTSEADVAPHIFVKEYLIVSVPGAMAKTVPVALTVQRLVAPEVHEPPGVASDNVIFNPWQTLVGPVMVSTTGKVMTVS